MKQAGTGNSSPSLMSLYMSEIRRNSASRREGAAGDWRELAEANLTFVLRIASEFRDLGLPFEDLVNEGNLGLLKAAKRYDADRGYKFTTYAVWWIRKSILKALGEQTRVVRVPVYMLRQRKQLQAAQKSPFVGNGSRRSSNGTAKPELTENRKDRLTELPLTELSLDKKIGEDGNISLGDSLADVKSRNPEESLLRSEAQDLVNEAIGMLSDQERTVIRYRFGLAGGRPLVLKQIGSRLGISRERVRQIEVQAKNRMRRYFARRASIYPTSGANALTPEISPV
jgi:RNA polymerase sigma factor (sigma-70 family)